MFIPKAVYEKLISVLEVANDNARKQSDSGIERVLSAKDHELEAIISAKDQQIDFLRCELDRAVQLAEHERHRAEAAIDILLVKQGEAGPVRNADLMRDVAEKEAAEGGIPRPAGRDTKADVLQKIFSSANAVLNDDDEADPLAKDEVFDHIGGVRVGG